MTASPMRPAQKLTMKTASYDPGAAAKTAKASTGPVNAPAMSSERCTPKALPQCMGGVASEIIASRGAVLMPLPRRSTKSSPANAVSELPTNSSPARVTVERK
jgi:hypothetical protein